MKRGMASVTKVLLVLIVLFVLNLVIVSFGGNFTGKVTGSCSESDSGNDPYTYGFVVGIDDRGFEFERKDYCLDDKLIEYYCADWTASNVEIHWYNCMYDCENGACKNP